MDYYREIISHNFCQKLVAEQTLDAKPLQPQAFYTTCRQAVATLRAIRKALALNAGAMEKQLDIYGQSAGRSILEGEYGIQSSR
ncbi:MAG: hypothetical protein NTY37_01290 [Methanothrix sp.]|nr:hypothetical protein [Methanothrix sp.]